MARIELSNIGGGGTTLSLTTTGTSGASTLAGSVLNIPIYQGQLTLTTTGTSGAATLSGTTLNIPQYSGGGGTPAGSAGQVQFNSTPAGSFAASSNLAWDNSNVRLNIGAPSSPTGRLNVKGSGATISTVNLRLTNSGDTELFRVSDNGFVGINNPSPSAVLSVQGDYPTVGAFEMLKTGISGTDAIFTITNGTSTTGQFLPQFTSISNYVLNGLSIGGFISARTTDTGSSDIGIIIDGRLKTPTSTFGSPMTRGWIHSFRGYATDYLRIAHNGNVVIQSGGTWTNDGYRLDVNANSATHAARFLAPNASGGTNALLVQNTTVSDLYKIEANGKVSYLANAISGTTGNQTINTPSGNVNFAAGATALTVTNSLCTSSSLVFATVRTNDTTAYIKNVVPTAGSFTINLGAGASAVTSVGFFIIN